MGPRSENDIPFREHFEQRIQALERLEDERWKSHEEVHAMGQRAIDAAVTALNLRLENMNEFRAQILNERGLFLKQEVYDIERRAQQAKMAEHSKWIDNMNGKLFGAGLIILGLSTVIGLLLRFWSK
jgi:hypothetical protein